MQAHDFITRHESSWHTLWQALAPNLPASQALLDELAGRYSEPHRHYHTLEHLDACLRHLASVQDQLERPQEIACALWFHDAIYAVGASDNELRSADWARQALLAAGGAADAADRIHAAIMVTRHDQPAQTADQRLLLDVDLAILGAPPAVFDAYEQQIVREYQQVPATQFRSNRRRILQGFLDRAQIYHSATFMATREAQARANLTRSIAALAD
ncbi:MAG: N-methyl-D-aspartate receptor NMDAR2C subunit [Burkholderiaceae bacterium]